MVENSNSSRGDTEAASSTDQIGLLLKVLRFASQKHRDQRRKDRERSPYINHPIDVAERVWNHGAYHDINAVCAALLHDTVEDTNTTFEELESLFGKQITDIVREVTDDKSLPKAERKQAQIDHGPGLSTAAKHIKLGDKTSNVTDMHQSPPPDWSKERRGEYLDWTKTVVDTMAGTNEQMEKEFREIQSEAKKSV